MSTRLGNLQRVRSLLDYPMPSHPSFAQTFQQALSVEADVLNATNNSDRPWAVETTQLNYTPGLTSYQLTAENFGKPLLVTRLLPNNPYIKQIVVPFAGFNDQLYGQIWQIWHTFYGWAWNINETPERMCFLREGVTDAQVSVTIEPQPQTSVTYVISYVPSGVDENASLESTVQMPEMSSLIQLRTAIFSLPYACWYEDEAANIQKRNVLKAGFEYQLSIKEPIFQRYISAMVKSRDVFVSNWNSAW